MLARQPIGPGRWQLLESVNMQQLQMDAIFTCSTLALHCLQVGVGCRLSK